LNQPSSPASVRKITLFAAINHLAKMADPRLTEPPQGSLKAITEALMFARQHDPEFGLELEEWAKHTLGLVSRIQSLQD
jgi:hypothetical protein